MKPPSNIIPVIMSQIKQHLHREEETLYEELMSFLEENEELFKQLMKEDLNDDGE